MEWKDRRSATLEGEGYNRGDVLSLTPVERERERERKKKGGEKRKREIEENNETLCNTHALGRPERENNL